MFQEPRLLPWRTVRQNIELVAAPDFSAQDLERLAHAVGIADMLPRYPQELSLGLARRVALARAFATKPDLLLLDEPFVSLDERTADRLRRLLLDVWQARPTTAILVTHNAREAILLADQLVLLAPRPTHVVAVETIAVPQAERDPKRIDAIMPICCAAIRPISPQAEPVSNHSVPARPATCCCEIGQAAGLS